MSTCTLTIFKNGDVEPASSELPAALTKTDEDDEWCWTDVNVRSAPESPRLKSSCGGKGAGSVDTFRMSDVLQSQPVICVHFLISVGSFESFAQEQMGPAPLDCFTDNIHVLRVFPPRHKCSIVLVMGK